MRKHCGNCANHKKETYQLSDECGKCVAAILENGETTDPSHWREKPKTNADLIRSMDDELLATQLTQVFHEGVVALAKVPVPEKLLDEIRAQFLEKLQQPAEGE